jgi:hypothetical protein
VRSYAPACPAHRRRETGKGEAAAGPGEPSPNQPHPGRALLSWSLASAAARHRRRRRCRRRRRHCATQLQQGDNSHGYTQRAPRLAPPATASLLPICREKAVFFSADTETPPACVCVCVCVCACARSLLFVKPPPPPPSRRAHRSDSRPLFRERAAGIASHRHPAPAHAPNREPA